MKAKLEGTGTAIVFLCRGLLLKGRCKTKHLLIAALICCLTVLSQMAIGADPEVNLVPWPQSLSVTGGEMSLDGSSQIVYSDASLAGLAQILAEEVEDVTRLQLTTTQGTSPSAGDIYLTYATDPSITGEAYKVTVASYATAEADNYNAVAMASVTILQAIKDNGGAYSIPQMTVTDVPDIGYRGLLVDVARQYHSIDTLKEMIEMCRLYKVRYLQIHLTDDQACTFPTAAYPLVADYGYTYTLAELQGLVAYADARGVILIPELDVPKHTGCFTYSMPDLFASPTDGIINFADPAVWDAIKTIINEMCDVFQSSPYFHVGADEANIWDLPNHQEYQDAFVTYDVDGIEGLFNYFINELNDTIKLRGKQTIAWEGFNSGMSGNSQMDTDISVMMFDNYKHPQDYMNAGHKVINASWFPLYVVGVVDFGAPPEYIFDWDIYQFGNYNNASTRVPDDVFWKNVSPTPDVIGAQMCSWEKPGASEIQHIRDRIAPYTDRVWNPGNTNNFAHFDTRFESTDAVLDYILADHQPPTVPTDVGASDGLYEDMIRVGWALSSNYPRYYALYRNTVNDSSTATLVTDTLSNSTTLYEDVAVVSGQTYYYWLKAQNNWGWSDFSAVASGSLGSSANLANAYEPFIYTMGSNIDTQNGGTGFNTAWDQTYFNGTVTAVADSLAYPGLPTEGGAMKVECVNEDTMFMERDMTDNAGYDMSNMWMSLLLRSEQVGVGHCFISANNASIGKGWGNGLVGLTMEADVTYFVVMRVDCRPGIDKIYTWINPSLGAEPLIDSSGSYAELDTGFGNKVHFNIQGHGSGIYIFDEIRIGSSWSDVTGGIGGSDIDPPTPNPASFATAPYSTGSNSISMVATTGSDASGSVEYYFTCTSGGGNDSGWQSSASYTDTGLNPGTSYTYTVTMRDLFGNVGSASTGQSATTDAATGPQVVENTATSYSGTWSQYDNAMYSGGSCHLGNVAGDYFEITFAGDVVRWYGLQNVDLGYADVYIDDNLVADNLDCYAASAQVVMLYENTTLSPGTHTIRVVVDGGKNSASSNTYLVHDYFEYEQIADATPPSAPAGLIASASDGSVNLDWADHSASDFDVYNVYRSTTSGSGFVSLAAGVIDSNYTDNSVVNGTTYYYVVTADDTSGNESAYSAEVAVTPYALSSTAIIENPDATYSGAWSQYNNAMYSGGSCHLGNVAGDYFEISFSGNVIRWYGLKNVDLGYADVYIDGNLVADNIDCYASSAQVVMLYENTNLSPDSHTIRVVVDGSKNAASTNTFLVHDYFEYELRQFPYGGTARAIPGAIEAEDYDDGGEGYAYHDNDTGNTGGAYRADDVDIETCTEGGYSIGWTVTGEWLEYTVNVTAETYNIDLRVATPNDGTQITVKLDDVVLGTATLPNTGGWQTWQTVTIPDVALSAGTGRVLRLEFTGEFNFNRIDITPTMKKVVVMVDSELYPEFTTDIDNYVADVEANFPVDLLVYSSNNYRNMTFEQIRSELQTIWQTENIAGVVQVGFFPSLPFHMGSHGLAPQPIGYMDMDGTFTDEGTHSQDVDGNWIYTPGTPDGYYDTHYWNDNGLEIWCSVIRPYQSSDTSTDYTTDIRTQLHDFFTRSHAYYNNQMVIPRRGLAYINNDWWVDGTALEPLFNEIYGAENTVAYYGGRNSGFNYMEERASGFEATYLYCHSASFSHDFDRGPWRWMPNTDLVPENGRGSVFTSGFNCHGADYHETPTGCMGQRYVFGCDLGQVFRGSGISFATVGSIEFSEKMRDGKYAGQAHVEVVENFYAGLESFSSSEPHNEVFGQILIGNPFVTTSASVNRSAAPASISGSVIGSNAVRLTASKDGKIMGVYYSDLGSFTIDNLPAGTYDVLVETLEGANCGTESVTVMAGQVLTGWDITLPNFGSQTNSWYYYHIFENSGKVVPSDWNSPGANMSLWDGQGPAPIGFDEEAALRGGTGISAWYNDLYVRKDITVNDLGLGQKVYVYATPGSLTRDSQVPEVWVNGTSVTMEQVTDRTVMSYWKYRGDITSLVTGGTDYITAKIWEHIDISAPVYSTDDMSGPFQSPYGGTARAIPGVIEAEHYDEGGEGLAYHDTTAGNEGGSLRTDDVDVQTCGEGGYNVGWTVTGEWLEYTVDIAAGTYDINLRVATTNASGQITVKLDGVTLGTANVPNTGDWQTYQTVTIPAVTLTSGTGKILTLEFTGEFNFNWIEFVELVNTIVEDPDATYSGTWSQYDNAMYSGGSCHLGNVAGDYFEITFTGDVIRWYGLENVDLGYADVYIDGSLVADNIDCYAASAQVVMLYENTGLSSGSHTIRVVVDGSKNAASSNTFLVHDYFEYLTGQVPVDTDPPTPNPATFATAPYATGTDSIAMVATTGSDASGPVEYYFTCTAGGGNDSGWQTSASYTDTGLTANTQYTYTVTMRDSLGNTGTASSGASATTDPLSWTQIIYDDFEGGLGNWTIPGTESFLYTGGTYAYQGSNAIDLQDNNNNSVCTTSNLALSGYSEVKVDFAYICVSMDNAAEDFWLQISTDGGSNFTTVEEWNQGDEFVNDQFYTDSVTITGYNLTDQMQIRFRCDASGNKDDVYIDAVTVSAQ